MIPHKPPAAPPASSKPTSPAAERPTYQDTLDEALEETFPASDPISPSAEAPGRRIATERNPTDWRLEPGSTQAPQPQPPAPGRKSS